MKQALVTSTRGKRQRCQRLQRVEKTAALSDSNAVSDSAEAVQ